MQSFRSDLEMILRRNTIAWNIFACASKELIINSRVCIYTIRSIQKSIYKANSEGGDQPTVEGEHVYLQYHTTTSQPYWLCCFCFLVACQTAQAGRLTGYFCVHEVFRLLAQASQAGWVSASSPFPIYRRFPTYRDFSLCLSNCTSKPCLATYVKYHNTTNHVTCVTIYLVVSLHTASYVISDLG